jgi:hypothetical protein
MRVIRFDPLAHPRNRMGVFVKTLRSMEVGDTLRMPGGVSISAREPALSSARPTLRVTAPLAHMKPVEISGFAPEKVARLALDRSARISHAGAVGGKDKTSWRKFRAAEVAARANDPAFVHVAPEDDQDLLARPTHGNPEENMERIEDLKSEAEQTLEDISDRMRPMDRETGYRDFSSGSDEDAYGNAEELIELANAALKQIEDMAEEVYDERVQRSQTSAAA